MRRMKDFFVIVLILVLASSCGNRNNDTFSEQSTSYITQQEDGTIILDLEKAYLLEDSLHPDMNTVEWSFRIKSKGRYELWLCSYTKDTMDLKYEEPVFINFQDKRIKAESIIGNEIVLDTPGLGNMYFRADSKLGSVYIENPGDYDIQLVGSKVRPFETTSLSNSSRHTELRSLILKPITE